MAKIQLKNISKKWGNSVGLKPMSLEIADGEFLVLLGPSGCGKTTTMRMVAGLEETEDGEIWIGDRCVNALEPKDRDVAMVFQSYGLYPNMTVYENISFPLRVRNLPVSEIDPAVRKAAAQVELTDFLDRKPKELSGGQRQRVALARAIVRKPEVFLMDEPLSNLDAKLRVTMRSHIKHLHHTLGVTTIYVTHDQIEAMTLADRVVVMSKAEIQQIGTPEEIYNNPANLFVAGFVGSPAMNLIKGHLSQGTFKAGDMSISGLTAAVNADVVLGIRPEDVTVTDTTAGDITGNVFSFELTGDATLVMLKLDDQYITAKADKKLRLNIGQSVGFKIDFSRTYLYDVVTEKRITV